MVEQPKCDICTLPQRRVYGNGSKRAKYLIIIDIPAAGDVKPGILMNGMAGRLIKRIFEAYGVPEYELYFTSIVQCRPPNASNGKSARPFTEREVKCCQGRFESEIAQLNPEKILVVGSQTCETLFGKKLFYLRSFPLTYNLTRRFQKENLWVNETKEVPTICTYSPGYILQNNTFYLDLVEDIGKLINIENREKYDYDKMSTYTVLNKEDDVYYLLSHKLAPLKKVAFDIETAPVSKAEPKTALDEKRGSIRCLGIGNKQDVYIFTGELFEQSTKIKRALGWLSKHLTFCVWNAEFEYKWMFSRGVDLGVMRDGMLVHHEVDERKVKRKLKWVLTRYNDWPNFAENLKETETDDTDWLEVPEELLYPYLAHDIRGTDIMDDTLMSKL